MPSKIKRETSIERLPRFDKKKDAISPAYSPTSPTSRSRSVSRSASESPTRSASESPIRSVPESPILLRSPSPKKELGEKESLGGDQETEDEEGFLNFF